MKIHMKESTTIQFIALALFIMIPTTIYFGLQVFFSEPSYSQARDIYFQNNISKQTNKTKRNLIWENSPEFIQWKNHYQHQINVRSAMRNGCMVTIVAINSVIASPFISAAFIGSAIILQFFNIFSCNSCALANEEILYIPLKIIRLICTLLSLAMVLYYAYRDKKMN